jgi:hypothetical protein
MLYDAVENERWTSLAEPAQHLLQSATIPSFDSCCTNLQRLLQLQALPMAHT